jgi:hypothetical protein
MKIKIEVFANDEKGAAQAQEGLEQLLGLIASNSQTPVPVLRAISHNHSRRLMCQVASNPHTDLSTLQELLQDEHESVRACVADHPKAINFMWKLVHDASPLVRYVLASNVNLPEHIFAVLAKDDDYRVARRAKRSLRQINSQDSLVGKLLSVFAPEQQAS